MKDSDISVMRNMPHWSYSAMQCYISCPLKYRFRYIDNAPIERTAAALPFGRSFHAALSMRARNGAAVSADDVKTCFADTLAMELRAAENLTYKQGDSADTLIKTGNLMLDQILQCWQDDYSVMSVAESFSVSVPGINVPLIGEFDMVVRDGQDPCIVDWKTSSVRWAADKADKDLQATAFSYAFKQVYETLPLFRFDVITKTKAPTVESHYTTRTDDALIRFEWLLRGINKAVTSGDFIPNETSFTCTDCPYRSRCKRAHEKGI